jgi:hypothetical protein
MESSVATSPSVRVYIGPHRRALSVETPAPSRIDGAAACTIMKKQGNKDDGEWIPDFDLEKLFRGEVGANVADELAEK